MAVVRVTPSGVMDKDTDMAYVSQGNYIDANDIRHRQTDGSTFGGVMSVAGNKELLNIPGYGSSTKTFRIYIDLTNIANGSVGGNDGDLYLENSSGTIYSNTGLNLTGTVIGPYIATLKTYFNVLSNAAYGGLFTYSATTITGTYTAYFDLSTALDTDYILRVNNGSSPLCDIRLSSEYYATGGNFKVIGSQTLQDYLFVWLASDVVSTGITSEVSEMGVIFTVDGGGTYNYRRLLRSKKMGFSTQRRIEAEIERNGDEVSLYFTDGYNKPRAMYLKYSLITTLDAFLFIGGGRYELETIDDETSFFYKVPSAYLEDIQVVEGGGTITAGNKRYTGRFLTEDLVPTDFLYPTNPVNIYLSDFSKPSIISGNTSSEETNKSVSLTLKNITPGIYKYFELIAIEYKESVVSPIIVQRYELDDNSTEINLVHSRQGQDNIPISVGELLSITSKYLTTQNLKVFDNRIVLSNLTEQVDYDLTSFAQSLTHSIHQKYVKGQGTPGAVVQSEPAYAFAEYQDPNNVLNYVGYMINDTYRFGMQVKWKNTGKWSSPYWVDDIRIDASTTNVIGSRRTMLGGSISSVDTANDIITINNHGFLEGDEIVVTVTSGLAGVISGFTYNADVLSPNTFKLTETIFGVVTPVDITTVGTGTVTISPIDVNLTSSNSSSVKAYHLRFHNYNLDSLVDTTGDGIADTPLRDLIEGFRIVRSERIPEVIASGVLFRGTTGAKTTSALTWWTPQGVLNDVVRVGGGAGTQRLFFYAPDFYYKYSYEFRSGTDKLKILKPYDRSNMIRLAGLAEGTTNSFYQDMPGYFAPRNTAGMSYTDYTITAHTHLDTSGEGTAGSDNVALNTDSGIVFPSCEIFKISTVIPALTAPYDTNEYGNYYAQIFRDLGGNKKYPINKESSIYFGVGQAYYLSNGENGIVNNITVFGGDVFTQKSHMKLHMTRWSSPLTGLGSAWSFYSQNRVNTQMMNVLDHDLTFTGPGYVYPQQLDKTQGGTYAAGSWQSGVIYWAEQWPEVTNQNNYDETYNIQSDGIGEQSYDENLSYAGSLPSRITWSAKKVIGSQKDNYRIFKPIDFADLDLTLGPIVHHDVINAAVYTWQPYSVQRQYFREASLIGAQEGTDIVVGSGSILGSPGVELTTIGADYKWNVVKGNTPNGKESAYWFNARLKKFVRFGQDGNRVISDKGLISFLQNNTRFLEYYGYPLTGKGIHAVWNDKYAEAIFTFKAINPSLPSWEVTTYAAGDYVLISPLTTYVHPSGLPYAYKCKLNHTASALTKPETGANWQTYWTKITPGTDSFTHTLFTIVYDEIKNGFITFHSYWPDIYLRYRNTFWSPNPLAPEEMCLHDAGLESEYYSTYYPPTITAVMNYDPNVSKNFEALQMVTDQQPFFVDLTTPNHISYLDETEFEEREDLWYSPIKNNSAVTGLNNGDTSRLWGKWLKVKLSLEASTGKQKLINFMVKFRPMSRLYNQ